MREVKEINQAEALRLINEEGRTAEELLRQHCPDAIRRFRHAMKTLDGVLRDVQKVFPDACYYSANDTPCLMLGDSHDSSTRSWSTQQELVAAVVSKPLIGGGDF